MAANPLVGDYLFTGDDDSFFPSNFTDDGKNNPEAEEKDDRRHLYFLGDFSGLALEESTFLRNTTGRKSWNFHDPDGEQHGAVEDQGEVVKGEREVAARAEEFEDLGTGGVIAPVALERDGGWGGGGLLEGVEGYVRVVDPDEVEPGAEALGEFVQLLPAGLLARAAIPA